MVTNVHYSGYSAAPSDYDCEDGSLALSIGVIPENGALTPIMRPKFKLNLGQDKMVKYIHEVSGGIKNYIIKDDNPHYESPIYRYSGDEGDVALFEQGQSEIYQITSIGNTLLFLKDSGIDYYLWKAGQGYIHIGNHLPELPISFGLQGEVKRSEGLFVLDSWNTIEIGGSSLAEDAMRTFYKIAFESITEQILPNVNQYIADEAAQKGKFLFPFLVRYAYRLYDGTLTMHSAPIFMTASSGVTPRVIVRGDATDGKKLCSVVGTVHSLDYVIADNLALSKLDDWADIVKSVDIFISRPIYTYDQNGKCYVDKSELAISDTSAPPEPYCICKHTNRHPSVMGALYYQKKSFTRLYNETYNEELNEYPARVPYKSAEVIAAEVENCSQFYLLKSIPISELRTTRTIIDVPKDYLENLVANEVMTDDYDSHDTLIPKSATLRAGHHLYVHQ